MHRNDDFAATGSIETLKRVIVRLEVNARPSSPGAALPNERHFSHGHSIHFGIKSHGGKWIGILTKHLLSHLNNTPLPSHILSSITCNNGDQIFLESSVISGTHPMASSQGSVVSTIGGIINTIISTIATVIMTIVGAIVTVSRTTEAFVHAPYFRLSGHCCNL